MFDPGTNVDAIPASAYNTVDGAGNLSSGTPVLNSITGTLGKAFDTFLGAAGTLAATKLVGSVYPTGSQDPAAVAAANKAAADKAAATNSNLKTYLLIGGAALVGVVLLISLTGSRK